MNAPPPVPAPPLGTSPNALHALGGVWRLTLREVFSPGQLTGTAIITAVLGLLTVLSCPEGDVDRFLTWVGGKYITLLVPVFAFVGGAGAMRDAMKSGLADYVVTRPVGRSAYLLMKYASHLGCSLVLQLATLAVLVGIGAWRELPGLWSIVPSLFLAQVLAVAAFEALGLACATVSANHLVIGVNYAVVVEVGLGQIPIVLNRLSILHHIRGIVPMLDAHGVSAAPIGAQLAAAGAISLIAAALLAVAVLVFSMREFSGAQPQEA